MVLRLFAGGTRLVENALITDVLITDVLITDVDKHHVDKRYIDKRYIDKRWAPACPCLNISWWFNFCLAIDSHSAYIWRQRV